MQSGDLNDKFPLTIRGLLNAKRQGKLAHAYLIYGDSDATREAAARFLAQLFTCAAADAAGRPCGNCRSCRQIADSSYAELYELSPNGKAGQIKVGDPDNPEPNTLRYFEAQFYLTSLAADGRKIGIIHDADAMNREAQNALLKTLEEPPSGSIFILTTGNPAALLPTTRSRCQLLPVLENHTKYGFDGAAELGVLLGKLVFGDGSATTAARGAEELVALAGKLAEQGGSSVLEVWEQRLAQAEALEDKALIKRVGEQQQAAAASAYLKLRDEFLSLIHTFCAQLLLLAVIGKKELLANPELFDGVELPEKIDLAVAENALEQAEKLLFRLRFQVDEALMLRAFALNVAIRSAVATAGEKRRKS